MKRSLLWILLTGSLVMGQDTIILLNGKQLQVRFIEIQENSAVIEVKGVGFGLDYIRQEILLNLVAKIILEDGSVVWPTTAFDSGLEEATTQQFDPETGLPVIEETELDTTKRFDSETGLPISKPSIQPQELPTDREPGAGESAKQGPVVDEKFKPRQVFYKQRFPIQFTFGRATDGKFVGGNGTLSYSFSKSIEIKGSRDIYESFYLYPALTLGTIYGSSTDFTDDGLIGNFEQYQVLYGIIEGHRRWEMDIGRPSVFVGVGSGRYWSSSEDAGTGFVLSAGAQLEGRRLMGGLRIYRIPGLRKFVTVTNMGYQPDTYKEALIVVGVGAVIAVPWLVFLLIFPGS